MRYKYLFGPVPSRRLGMSLGIDLIPKKVCSLDCVYCEVGATTKLTTKRMEYVLYDKVVAEIDDYMSRFEKPDFMTFSGSGEPTLNIRFGDVLGYIRNNYPDVKIAVLTNGTLMNDPAVREEMMPADMVMPSLDAVSSSGLKKINRPAEGIEPEKYIQGIETFAKEYKGTLNLEILFLKGYNTGKDELLMLKDAISRISPHSVQLNTLDRPGTVDGLEALSFEELKEIADFWQLPNVEIIAKPATRKENKAFVEDYEAAIFDTIKRRPCTLNDLSKMLGLHVSEINKYLDTLDAAGKIETQRQSRGVFYKVKG